MDPQPRPDPGSRPPGDTRTLEIYKSAIDEYRFQTQLNWSRTQYLLALNVGILVAGAAIAANDRMAPALVFALGVIAGPMSILALRTQHEYYRAARSRMRRLEDALGLAADQRVDTTATMAGRRHPRASVTAVTELLIAAIIAADIAGIIITLT